MGWTCGTHNEEDSYINNNRSRILRNGKIRWNYNIKMNLNGKASESELNSCDAEHSPLAGCCVQGNEQNLSTTRCKIL